MLITMVSNSNDTRGTQYRYGYVGGYGVCNMHQFFAKCNLYYLALNVYDGASQTSHPWGKYAT